LKSAVSKGGGGFNKLILNSKRKPKQYDVKDDFLNNV